MKTVDFRETIAAGDPSGDTLIFSKHIGLTDFLGLKI